MQTTITQHDLSQFNPPLEGQEAANWALENLGERIGFSSYKDVLRHLGITINPTQSGIITLQPVTGMSFWMKPRLPIWFHLRFTGYFVYH